MNKNKRKHKIKIRNTALSILTIACSLFTIHFTNAQTATNSPYSRYGLGEINSKTSGQSFGMGGASIALQNDTLPMFFINTGNPASYSSVRLTTAELGINYTRLEMKNETSKEIVNSAALSYLTLAFPIKKWWGASVGLVPYSSVGYKISDHESTIPNVSSVEFLYEGSGGINQLYFGNGVKPLYGLPKLFLKSDKYKQLVSKTNKDNTAKSEADYHSDLLKAKHLLNNKKQMQQLSVGFNASYLFGHVDHSRRSIFPTSSGNYNTYALTSSRVSDVYFDYGIQYSKTLDSLKGRDLKDNVKLLIGATFAAQTKINAKTDSLTYNYFYNTQGYEYVKDTVENSPNTSGNITLPLSFGVGLGFKKGDHWTVLADFAMQNWSSYQAFNQSGGLKNSMRVSLGAQWVPNSKAGQKKYLSRIHYRIGGRYGQTSLEIKSTQLTETAASIGFGFPVGRNYLLQNFSMVNIGVEAGMRGTTTNGLLKENFYKITVGFTINDRWFVKPKFD